MQFVRDLLDVGLAAAAPDVEGEPPSVVRIVGQPVETLVLHAATLRTKNPAKEEREGDASVACGEVPDRSVPLVVGADVSLAADAANRFFRLRCSEMTTAIGSPKTPRMRRLGAKPGKRYRSRRCLK